MRTKKLGRIAGDEWLYDRPDALAVYNGQYAISGHRYFGDYPKPWTVIGGGTYAEFTTHAEALAWAFKEAEANK